MAAIKVSACSRSACSSPNRRGSGHASRRRHRWGRRAVARVRMQESCAALICLSRACSSAAWCSQSLRMSSLTTAGVAMSGALMIKIRDADTVDNKAAHLVIGVDLDGNKQVLGIWIAAAEGCGTPTTLAVAPAVGGDAQHGVDGPVGDMAVSDLDVDDVDEQHCLDHVQRPGLPSGQAVQHPAGD